MFINHISTLLRDGRANTTAVFSFCYATDPSVYFSFIILATYQSKWANEIRPKNRKARSLFTRIEGIARLDYVLPRKIRLFGSASFWHLPVCIGLRALERLHISIIRSSNFLIGVFFYSFFFLLLLSFVLSF